MIKIVVNNKDMEIEFTFPKKGKIWPFEKGTYTKTLEFDKDKEAAAFIKIKYILNVIQEFRVKGLEISFK